MKTYSTDRVAHRARWLWLVGCLITGGYFAIRALGEGDAHPAPATPAAMHPVALKSQQPWTKPIDQIRVGERVLGRNPLRDEVDSILEEPNPRSWRRLTLAMEKPDRGLLEIELLRSLAWIESKQVRVGGTVWLFLPELDAEGDANVLAIDPCPPINPGQGRVVIGTFAHPVSDNLLNLFVEGADEPIGVTDGHLVWSKTQGRYVPAGELQVDEEVLTFRGDALRVVSVLPRPGPARVYNLEVQSEHVYHVSSLGILAHNCSDSLDAIQGVQKHHPTPRMFLRALADAGFDVKTVYSTGRTATVSQKPLKYLARSEHVGSGINTADRGIHEEMDIWFGYRAIMNKNPSLNLLKAEPGNSGKLAKALIDKDVKPSEMFDILEEHYRMNFQTDMADNVRNIADILKAKNPGKWH